MIPISVLVQTKNEEVGIAACLSSLREFAEVIVVDSNSIDNTATIAADMGVRVEIFSWDGHYPKKKQWQLDNLTTRFDWVLFIDADETPTQHLIDNLKHNATIRNQTNVGAIDLQLVYTFDGRRLMHGHRVQKRSLVNRRRARFPVINDLAAPGMGELEGHYQPTVVGDIEFIANALLHDDQDPVRTWFERHNRYSDWEAYLRTHTSTRRTVGRLRSRQGRAFDALPGKPVAFFIYAFIAKAGFRDGVPGMNYALALAFYYWQINLKVRELNRMVRVKHGRERL